MPKNIVSVGVQVPGGDVEEVSIWSDRSLLDADIVLFSPGIPQTAGESTYVGKRCLSDDASFKARRAMAHWKRELLFAADAGKLIVVLLSQPESVYVATGDKKWSGTGRNARATRMVEELSPYDAIPFQWKYRAATGTEMAVASDARFFAPYWTEFGKDSTYRLYLDAPDAKPLVKTRSGNLIVGAYVPHGKGAFVALPELELDDDAFVESRLVKGGDYEDHWSKEGVRFGKRLIGVLSAMADSLASEVALSPPPDWAGADDYRLLEEVRLEEAVAQAERSIERAVKKRMQLADELSKAGELRHLLFEQGKPLEHAVRRALEIMGFEASQYAENDSEFDVVFTSSEGRFIGEVEGRDSKAINIDKFSQLERNIAEDFARDEVSVHAKGVLFGNAHRLKPLAERAEAFTEKCMTAATRLQAALVRTQDLFDPCRYLMAHKNPAYAKSCREALMAATGTVVFPTPPDSQ